MIDLLTEVQRNPFSNPDTVPNIPLPRFEEVRSHRASADGKVRLPETGVTGFVINESTEGMLVALWGPAVDAGATTIVVRRDGHESAHTVFARWSRRVADGMLVGYAFDEEPEEVPVPLMKRTPW